MKRINYLTSALVALSAAAVLVGTPAIARAQQASTQYACYIPGSGTVYRIKAPNTPANCSAGHQEFVVSGGSDAATPIASASGGSGGGGGSSLPTNSVGAFDFSNQHGFVSIGTQGIGNTPKQGAGTRFMWYPARSAVRGGNVDGTQWNDFNTGVGSVAFGINTKASGYTATAMGDKAVASGQHATAIGSETTASGQGSVALGQVTTASATAATALGGGNTASGITSLATGSGTTASGVASTAMGQWTLASGDHSTAMGKRASTNGKIGAFVYGDASQLTNVSALVNGHFVVRASRFWFGRDNGVTATNGRFIETSTGAYLSSGGVWVSASDSTKKHHWNDVDGEAVLAKLSTLPVRTWSYRAEDDSVRHMGPTAQDFHNVFGLGDSDKGIGSVDADGVSLAGIKALIERTAQLQRENDDLRRDNAEVRTTVAELVTRITSLESAQR